MRKYVNYYYHQPIFLEILAQVVRECAVVKFMCVREKTWGIIMIYFLSVFVLQGEAFG